MRFSVLQVAVSLFLVISCNASAQDADTLTIIDITANPSTDIPVTGGMFFRPNSGPIPTFRSKRDRESCGYALCRAVRVPGWRRISTNSIQRCIPLWNGAGLVNQFRRRDGR